MHALRVRSESTNNKKTEQIMFIINIRFILGLRFNTGIGQHILKNPMIIVNMIDKVSVISNNFLVVLIRLI